MTGWFNSHFAGAAVTVEYGARPSRHRCGVGAAPAGAAVFGARRVPLR